jgi:hypothetical protein
MIKSLDRRMREMRRRPICLAEVLSDKRRLLKSKTWDDELLLYKVARSRRVLTKQSTSMSVMSTKLPPLKCLRGSSISPSRLRFIERPRLPSISPTRFNRSPSPQINEQGTQTKEESRHVDKSPQPTSFTKSISTGRRMLVPSNMMARRPSKSLVQGRIYTSVYSRLITD